MLGLAGLAKAILPTLFGTIDKAVKDKDLAEKLKHDTRLALLSLSGEELKAARDVIVAEAGGNALQRNWRPITMLTFVFIIANNYILVPYAVAFGAPVPMLIIPPGMWSLLTVGIGGYIASRGIEKVQEIKARK
jgi:hypothetical protein